MSIKPISNWPKLLIIVCASCLLFSCATVSKDNPDPLESYNRAMFKFNDKVDTYVFKPVAKTYKYILPYRVREGVTNFFDNLATIPTIVNDLLQLQFYQATSDTWRLFFNTTFGIGGLFDVASRIGLEPNEEDFGITLAKWGYKNSAFFVLPLLGPSTVRDAIGIGVDYYFFSVYPHINSVPLRTSLLLLNAVNTRASFLEFEDVAEIAALDPYVFERNAYLQNRRYKIKETHEPEEDLYIEENNQHKNKASTNNPF